MLILHVDSGEFWNEEIEEFVYSKPFELRLEHSLVSISKWEQKWHKPYISKDEKTKDETIDYIKCMTLTQNVPDDVYYALTSEHLNQIKNYLEDGATATVIKTPNKVVNSGKFVTSELIYYWMFKLGIPIECQKWNLNRLFTLIEVFNAEDQPQKKMSRKEQYAKQAALNAKRKAAMKSRG